MAKGKAEDKRPILFKQVYDAFGGRSPGGYGRDVDGEHVLFLERDMLHFCPDYQSVVDSLNAMELTSCARVEVVEEIWLGKSRLCGRESLEQNNDKT